jgi:hypothetical protein
MISDIMDSKVKTLEMDMEIKPLLTPEKVAEILQISVEAVYKHKHALCGFYPAGIKVLRFREDVIDGIIQNVNGRVAVRVPEEREALQRQRIQYQSRGESSTGKAPERNIRRQNPSRHGL